MLVCILAGMAGGAAWALIPALLKAYRGVHEVVTTIMMNFVATSIAEFAVAPNGPFVSAGQPSATERVPAGAQLPIIWEGTRLHAGLLIAIAAIVIVLWLLYRTPAGFRLRLMGANAGAARASGISISRVTILALLGSGALGGLAGAVQVLGVYGRFFASFSPGYGFDAIAVALLGALSRRSGSAPRHSSSPSCIPVRFRCRRSPASAARWSASSRAGSRLRRGAAQRAAAVLETAPSPAITRRARHRAETTPFQSDAARLEDAP